MGGDWSDEVPVCYGENALFVILLTLLEHVHAIISFGVTYVTTGKVSPSSLRERSNIHYAVIPFIINITFPVYAPSI